MQTSLDEVRQVAVEIYLDEDDSLMAVAAFDYSLDLDALVVCHFDAYAGLDYCHYYY